MIKRPVKLSEDNNALIGQLANTIVNLKTNFNKAMHIGSGNSGKIELIPIGDNQSTRNVKFANTYANLNATDAVWFFQFPLPLSIYDLDGNQKVLYITITYIGLYDADDGDEVDRIIWRAWDTNANYDTLADTGAGYDGQPEGLETWDHADFEVPLKYERLILYVGVINTTAGDLEISQVYCNYYYDTPT